MSKFNIEIKPQPDGKFEWIIFVEVKPSVHRPLQDLHGFSAWELKGTQRTAEKAIVKASKIVAEHVQRDLIEDLKKSFNEAAPVSRASV